MVRDGHFVWYIGHTEYSHRGGLESRRRCICGEGYYPVCPRSRNVTMNRHNEALHRNVTMKRHIETSQRTVTTKPSDRNVTTKRHNETSHRTVTTNRQYKSRFRYTVKKKARYPDWERLGLPPPHLDAPSISIHPITAPTNDSNYMVTMFFLVNLVALSPPPHRVPCCPRLSTKTGNSYHHITP